jgi:hypothetical protein
LDVQVLRQEILTTEFLDCARQGGTQWRKTVPLSDLPAGVRYKNSPQHTLETPLCQKRVILLIKFALGFKVFFHLDLFAGLKTRLK